MINLACLKTAGFPYESMRPSDNDSLTTPSDLHRPERGHESMAVWSKSHRGHYQNVGQWMGLSGDDETTTKLDTANVLRRRWDWVSFKSFLPFWSTTQNSDLSWPYCVWHWGLSWKVSSSMLLLSLCSEVQGGELLAFAMNLRQIRSFSSST